MHVEVLASRQGGLLYGPFVPDTRGAGRFPPAVRLRASLVGIPLGQLTIEHGQGFGLVLDLSIGGSWLSGTVAASLLEKAAALAPQADWRYLLWEVPASDARARTFARSLGFQPENGDSGGRRLRRPLGSP